MKNQNPVLRILCLVLAAWLGAAGFSLADPSTPTAKNESSPSTGNDGSSLDKSSSAPKPNDVSSFGPSNAAVINSSVKTSPALLNSQVQAGAKVSVEPGPIQKLNQAGVSPGQKSGKRSKTSKLTKVGASPGPVQKRIKVGVGPGPVQKLNAGAISKAGGTGDMSQSSQLKLQQTMNNKTKMSQTFSNVMKANQDTEKGAVGNMK